MFLGQKWKSLRRRAWRCEHTPIPAWVPAALGCGTFAIGYCRSFLLPAIPLLLWGDALGYATKAARILEGELPYRDFFDFVTPGAELSYALLFRIVGVMLWGPNLLMCIMAALTTVWVTWCARTLVPGWFACLPALLVSGIVLAGSFDATHHWFSTLFALGAVSVLFHRVSSRRVAIAGILCGLTASFTQSKGAAVTLALLVYLWWKSRTEEGSSKLFPLRGWQLCLLAVIVFLSINLPFVLAAGVHRWYWHIIIFPLRYFGSVSANNWHGMVNEFAEKRGVLKWVCLPALYLGVPISYSWAFLRVWRTRNGEGEKYRDQLLLLALVGSAMLIMVVPALSLRRISCVSLPPWSCSVRR